ncbi:hypothetical protein [Streptomyces sp. TLI_55]|uniref:hypothetical protein n=1 Tax=Streptomyces sp. TLI_55 TaxID=1938861 RepID=UPI00117E0ED3|nr:hypothetical protein [Streptomyces sp. TLI_55]
MSFAAGNWRAAQEVADAEAQQSRAQQRVRSAGRELVHIVKDILGINAAMDCISSGDLGACGETLLNIAGSFAGGIAGKLLAKYGMPWNIGKGIKLAKRVTGLLKDLFGGLKAMSKASERLNSARAALTKAREKALAAVDKIKGSVGGRDAGGPPPGYKPQDHNPVVSWQEGSNAAGGRVFTSNKVIAQNDFVSIVNDARKRGDDIHILTGAHGSSDGIMTAERRFYAEDISRFGDFPGVTVHHVPSMSPEDISGVLQSPGTIIGAFCHSATCLNPYR